jgi:hypothetical protein
MSPLEVDKVRAAFGKLTSVVAEVVAAVEQAADHRCPYRNVRDECTFDGPCGNRMMQHGGGVRCRADRLTHE